MTSVWRNGKFRFGGRIVNGCSGKCKQNCSFKGEFYSNRFPPTSASVIFNGQLTTGIRCRAGQHGASQAWVSMRFASLAIGNSRWMVIVFCGFFCRVNVIVPILCYYAITFRKKIIYVYICVEIYSPCSIYIFIYIFILSEARIWYVLDSIFYLSPNCYLCGTIYRHVLERIKVKITLHICFFFQINYVFRYKF